MSGLEPDGLGRSQRFRNTEHELVQAKDQSTTVTHSSTLSYNPRTYQDAVFPNITDIDSNVETLLDVGSATDTGRLYYLRVDDGNEYGPHRIYYASASNEISLLYSDNPWTGWTQYGSNPVASSFTSGNFQVLKEGDTYHAFYSKPNNTQIAHKTSPDGIDWSASETVILSTSSTGWDERDIRYPGVVRYEGQYLLYYMGLSDAQSSYWRIGLAAGNDPDATFEKHPMNPVIEPTQAPFDDHSAFDPHPLIVNGKMLMGYTGGSDQGGDLEGSETFDERLGYAMSTDGVNFTKHPDNPLIGPNVGGQDETLNLNTMIDGEYLYAYFVSRNDAKDNYVYHKARTPLYEGV